MSVILQPMHSMYGEVYERVDGMEGRKLVVVAALLEMERRQRGVGLEVTQETR